MNCTVERIESRLVPEPNTGCWLWTGASDRHGYGRIGVSRRGGFGRTRTVLAHRLAYEVFRGPIPNGLHVCHRCDTPACCNPDHLFLGTATENMADKVAKGRQAKGETAGGRTKPENFPRGEEHWHARITSAEAEEILRDYSSGSVTQDDLARRHDVTRATVNDIVHGRTWAHIRGSRTTGDRRYKLSEDEVSRVRQAYARGGVTQTQLAEQFGVTQAQVSLIVLGKSRGKAR